MIKTSNRQEFSSAFIIPHYADGYEQEQGRKKLFIAETIEGLFSQTDEGHRLIRRECSHSDDRKA